MILSLCSCNNNTAQNNNSTTDKHIENVSNKFSDENENLTKINVNLQLDKTSILASNSEQNENISYSDDKSIKSEVYTKDNVENRTINIIGVDFSDMQYVETQKGVYRDFEYDYYKNESDSTLVFLDQNSNVVTFAAGDKVINLFEEETADSPELAKKYLNLIAPEFEYNDMTTYSLKSLNQVNYIFYKTVGEIRCSERVSVLLDESGELVGFKMQDIGRYNNVGIESVPFRVYSDKVDEYIKSVYSDSVVECNIKNDDEMCPIYYLYKDNSLDLYIPIELKLKTEDNVEYSSGEIVVLTLN